MNVCNLQDTTIPPPHTLVQVHKPGSSNSFTETLADVTYSLEQAIFDLVTKELTKLGHRSDYYSRLR
jgi:hypothetical protein